MNEPRYNRQYEAVSVYGNVVDLLGGHTRPGGVHIDLGCGYGAIAETIAEKLDATYIGIDTDEECLSDLRARGFEALNLDVSDLAPLMSAIQHVSQSRPVHSISCLDILEHLADPAELLHALSALAREADACLVVSYPNVTHKDVGLKLLAGRWDKSKTGLLDETHLQFVSEGGLEKLMDASGWREVADLDWRLETSDQAFPDDFPLFRRDLPSGEWFRGLASSANPHFTVNQFVRAYRPVQRAEDAPADPVNVPPQRTLCLVVLYKPGLDVPALLGTVAPHLNEKCRVCVLHQDDDDLSSSRQAVASLDPQEAEAVTFVSVGAAGRTEAVLQTLIASNCDYGVLLDENVSFGPTWMDDLVQMSEAFRGKLVWWRGDLGPDYWDEKACETALGFSPFWSLALSQSGGAKAIAAALPIATVRHLFSGWGREGREVEFGDLTMRVAELAGVVRARSPVFTWSSASEDGQGQQPAVIERSALDDRPVLAPAGTYGLIQTLVQQSVWFDEKHHELLVELERQQRGWRMIGTTPSLRDFVTERTPGLAGHVVREPISQEADAPFLSVIVRTLAKSALRLDTLRDVLISLAGQSSDSFELIIVVHNSDPAATESVEAIVSEYPDSFKRRVRVMSCDRGGRSAPLNQGVASARGRYIAALDDDDFVFANWVEEFERLATAEPGAVLRSACVRQKSDSTQVGSSRQTAYWSSGWFEAAWPKTYDFFDHLWGNFSPFMSLAFPRSLFSDVGLKFREDLAVLEDWDFATRAAMICGVSMSSTTTCVYRWWENSESSLFTHSETVWEECRSQILADWDAGHILLPPGMASRLSYLKRKADDHPHLAERLRQTHSALHESAVTLVRNGLSADAASRYCDIETEARSELHDLLSSKAWRYTRRIEKVRRLWDRSARASLKKTNMPTTLAEQVDAIAYVNRSPVWRFFSFFMKPDR